MAVNPATSAARKTRNSRPLLFLARLGYAVSGLLHILIGVIAIEVANGTGGEADQSGALSQLASTPGGVFILWTVVIGLTALGLWLIVSAILPPASDNKKRAAHFITDSTKGIVYILLAVTAFTFARGSTTNSAASTGTASRDILTSPGGVATIAVIGAAIFAVGIYLLIKAISKRFTKDLTVPRGGAGRATVGLGILGYVAKGIALGTVGAIFLTAALTGDASKADGLDGALKTLATLPYGPVILILVGAGLIAYGLYSFVRARFARL